MRDEIDRVLERARQFRQAAGDGVAPMRAPDAFRPLVSGSTLVAGDRVFDLVSGVEGEAAPAPRSVSDPTPRIVVRLTDGRIVTRTPDQLVPRPTPPPAG